VTTIPLDPARQAELEHFATTHGQTAADALDQAVAMYLEMQSLASEDDIAAVMEAIGDLEAGRSVSLEEFDTDMRRRYQIPH
jgi:predicted transcriptional regulator